MLLAKYDNIIDIISEDLQNRFQACLYIYVCVFISQYQFQSHYIIHDSTHRVE